MLIAMTRLQDAMPSPGRTFALVFACCFAIGGANHARDLVQGGVFPYHAVPLAINVFWSALCPIDFALAALIWIRRRAAITLGILVLLLDVGVNSWIAYFSNLHVSSFEPLQVQSLFLGFVLGGALFALRQIAGDGTEQVPRSAGGRPVANVEPGTAIVEALPSRAPEALPDRP
jgi:hypothetical protein